MLCPPSAIAIRRCWTDNNTINFFHYHLFHSWIPFLLATRGLGGSDGVEGMYSIQWNDVSNSKQSAFFRYLNGVMLLVFVAGRSTPFHGGGL